MTTTFERDLGFNERFSVTTTQQSRIGTIPDPVIDLCGTAKTSAELENISAAGATPAFLARGAAKTLEDIIAPKFAEIFAVDPTSANRQSRESPILEQIQNLSRLPAFTDGTGHNKLIVVSDMLQNTQELQFCSTQGHLPRFEKFKQKADFERLRPMSLSGTEITVYLLIRGILGKAPYSFCTEPELTQWWRDYFEDAGASNVTFIRVRQGG